MLEMFPNMHLSSLFRREYLPTIQTKQNDTEKAVQNYKKMYQNIRLCFYLSVYLDKLFGNTSVQECVISCLISWSERS